MITGEDEVILSAVLREVSRGLTHGVGQKMVDVACSDSQKVQGLAYRGAKGVTLCLANVTADKQVVNLAGVNDASFVTMLDEASFVKATTDPRGFKATHAPLKGKSVTLSSYAVAFLSIND